MAAIFTVAAAILSTISLQGASRDTLLREEYSFGSFEKATRVIVGPQGWMYVADEGKNTISLIRRPGDAAVEIGGFGWSQGTFDKPTGLATDGLNLYVSDQGNHRVQRFDRNLNFLSSLSTRDTAFSQARFGYPMGVAISPMGDLFILDMENVRVVKFTANSQYERTFGDMSSGGRKLRNPRALRVENGRVFVGESDRILVFDYYGNYMRTIGEGSFTNLQGFDVGAEGIVVAEENTLEWLTLDGEYRLRTEIPSILSETPIGPVRDVVLNGGRLYLLDGHHLVVLTVVH
ncbi:MAG: NHL repeat-containing protein [Bacteroidota bacterium]